MLQCTQIQKMYHLNFCLCDLYPGKKNFNQVFVSLSNSSSVLANSDLAGTFLGFSVYVSNTTVKEDGYLCYHDTTYTPSTIPSSLTIECTMPGRYVIYFNTREGNLSTKPGYSTKAQINLCEVEVYGINYYIE